MLQSMRNGVFSGFFLVILLLGGIGLVVSDGGGFFRSGVKGTDIAKIGDKTFHVADFDRSLRLILRQQGISPQKGFEAGLVHQFLAQEINRAAVRQEANDLGIVISQKEVAKLIGALIDPVVNIGTTKEEAFDLVLQTSNMSEKDLLQEFREDAASKVLYQAIEKNTLPLSETLINTLAQLQAQTRTIEFLDFPHEKTSGVDSPSDEKLSKYYNTVKSIYARPERRDLSLLIVDTQRLKERVDISESTLQAFYKENIDQFTSPEKRELHQAVFEDEATALSVVETFENTLEETVEKITGETKAFLGVQSFEKDSLLNALSEDIFSADNDSIVGPLKTALGWHVFQVTAILSENVKPIESVSQEIKDILFQEKMADELYALGEELDDRLVAGDTIETLVNELPIKHVELSQISSLEGERISKLTPEDQELVFRDSFQLYEEENTPIEEFSDGRFFTVYVHKIYPSTIPPLKDVREELLSTWITQQKQAKNFADTQALISDIESQKIDFETLNPLSKTLSTTDDLPFNLSRQGLDIFFSAEQGDVKLARTEEGIVLGRVKSINIPKPESLNSTKVTQIKTFLTRQLEQELMSSYVAHLQKVRDAQINDALLTQYYAPRRE